MEIGLRSAVFRLGSAVVVFVTASVTALVPRANGQCNAQCNNITLNEAQTDDYIIGSPSGLARPFTVRLNGGTGNEETWILNFTDPEAILFHKCMPGVECSETFYNITLPPYQEVWASQHVAVFNPTFSGFGSVSIAAEISCCPGYVDFSVGIPARSTDFDIDGDTDNTDVAMIDAAVTNSGSLEAYDLNNDGVLTTADSDIVRTERDRAAPRRQFCLASPTPPPAITNLSISNTTCDAFTVSWTEPADACVTQYDLRMSSQLITSNNFGSATVVTPPTPQSPGSTRQKTVQVGGCQTKFFAVKSRGAGDLWSNLSNVTSGSTPCDPDCNPLESIGGALEGHLSLGMPSPNPAGHYVAFDYSVPFELEGSNLELAVFDAAGRKIRTLLDTRAAVGTRSLRWDLKGKSGALVEPGLYVIRLDADDRRISRAFLVTR